MKNFPNPGNPFGFSVFQLFNAALKKKIRKQKVNHRTVVTKSRKHVCLSYFESLHDHVNSRSQKVKTELLGGEMEHQHLIQFYNTIKN